MVTFDVSPTIIIAAVLGIVLPLLVGLVTKRVTSSAVKGLLLAALSVVGGLLTEIGAAIVSGTSFDVTAWLVLTLTALISGQATYSSIWKPTGTATALQELGTKH